jgi:hypothetical protein
MATPMELEREAIAKLAVQTTNTKFGGDPNISAYGGSSVKTAPVPADQLGTQTAIKMPTVNPDTTQADGTVAGATQATKGIDQYLKEITPPETDTSKQYSALQDQINTLLPDLANKGKDQLQQEKDLGLPQLKQQLAALNSQILTRTAQYEKAYASAETKAIPMSDIIGTQASVRRAQAADIGLLQARALGLQGQVEMAQQTADRAIDLKYDTLKDTLDVKMQQLELIKPLLDKEERLYAAALERKYLEEDRSLEERKAKAKENMALALEAGLTTRYVNKNGEFFHTATGETFQTPEEFFKHAGVTSFQDAYNRGLIGDYNPNMAGERKLVADMIANYSDAGITMADTLESAQAKLSGSRIYQGKVRPPVRSGGGGGGSGSTATITTSQAQKYGLPTDTSKETFSDVINGINSAKQELAGEPYYEIWGKTVDWLRDNGEDPTRWDNLLWEMLHPDGLSGKTKSSTSERDI